MAVYAWHEMPGTRCLARDAWHVVPGRKNLALDAWHVMLGTRCMEGDACHEMPGTRPRHEMPGTRCLAPDAWHSLNAYKCIKGCRSLGYHLVHGQAVDNIAYHLDLRSRLCSAGSQLPNWEEYRGRLRPHT